MKRAKVLVFLADHPILIIEIDLNNILCVLSIIDGIYIYSSLLDTDAHRDLEEVRPGISVIFVARFYMVHKNL